jgi:hypothetical protein
MSSSYTDNLGIEEPATGEQAGSWGETANTNFQILDQALGGQISITLADAADALNPNELYITDGAVATGGNAYIELIDAGDLGTDVYLRLSVSTSERICYIKNSLTTQSILLFQGIYDSGRSLTITAGQTKLVKFDGGGDGVATVTAISVTGSGGGGLGAAGDLLAFDGNLNVEIAFPVGTDDQILIADSAEDAGFKWANNAAGFADPMTTRGDVIIRNASNVTARLAVGANDYVLTSDGTDISWEANSGGGASPLTTNGDIWYYAGGDARLARGATGEFLVSTATGIEWQAGGGGGGGVDSVSVTAPITNTGSASIPDIGITQAGVGTDGYLDSTDWNTFNDRIASVSSANTTIDAATVAGAVTLTLNPDLSITTLLCGSTATADSFISTSARDKKNILHVLENNRADDVLNLQPYVYTLKDSALKTKQIGYIADEVAQLFPEVVTFDQYGKESGLDYSRLVVPAIEKIKQQEKRIFDLEYRLNELIARMK